ncbi:MAG TPA: MFS transporter [Polyangiales bacterium]|nr:MFS transporter [Polyangiales bacterium]
MTGPSAASAVQSSGESRASWVTRDVKRIFVTQVVFGFGWSLYLLIPKFLATQLKAPPDLIGQISAMGGAAGLLTAPFAAFGLDRYERKFFFRAGASLIIVASVGMTLVHEVTPLIYVLQGCVSAAFVLAFNATAALLSDYAPPERLGQAIGWLGGANVAMNAVATMIAEPLATSFGWPAVFALGVIAGCAAFVLSFGLRSAPRVAAVAPLEEGVVAAKRGGRANRGVVLLLVSATVMGAVFIALFGFVQPYAVSLGAHELRYFFLGFTLAAVCGRVLLGGLGDRLGRRVVSIWMLGGYAAAAAFMRELDIDLLMFYGVAFGAAHGLLYPTLNALLLELLPAGRRGLGMVLYNGAFNLGTSMGSLGWGLLAKHEGYPAVYATAALSALLAGALLFVKPRES